MRVRRTGQRVFDYTQADQRLQHGLVYHWLGHGSGLSAQSVYKTSPAGELTTFTGGIAHTLGPNGHRHALESDGTGQITLATEFDPTDIACSFAFWINPYATQHAGGYGAVLAHNAGSSGIFYRSTGADTDKLSYYYVGDHVTAHVFTRNTWTHVVINHDGGSTIDFYINGRPDSTHTSDIGGVGNGALAFLFGHNPSASEPFFGKLADIRIYNRMLYTAEIATLADPAFRPFVATGRRRINAAAVAGAILPHMMHLS